MSRPFSRGRMNEKYADTQRRRDGSQASKAKSNKTIDYQHIYQNMFDPVQRMNAAINPLYSVQTQLPPLEQYERYITQVPAVLTKYVNRRKCEEQGASFGERNYVDLTFTKYNPDGRFLFAGSSIGTIYVYNTYDFSFHYQYLIQNRQHRRITGLCFHPNNQNAAFVCNEVGQVHYYENILHYDISMTDKLCEIDKRRVINSVNCSSCGTQIVMSSHSGMIATAETHRTSAPDQLFTKNVFHTQCNDAKYSQFGKQIIICCGEKLKVLDQRVKPEQMEVQETTFRPQSEDQINKIALHRGGNLVAAAGSDGCRIFDFRMLPNKDSTEYRCLYQVKPKNEIQIATSVMWHPLYSDYLIVGDQGGDVNFYSLNYSNAAFGFEHVFEDQFLDTFKTEILQQPLESQTAQLFSLGYIYAAHRQKNQDGVAIIDMDVHPSGNSLATAGKDKDVRFWTYFGAGCYQNDWFHNGKIDPCDNPYQFNQSHRELQDEQEDLMDKIKIICGEDNSRQNEKIQTKEGEDVFTREEVQTMMKQYISTADEREREAEEQEFIREKEFGTK